MRSFRVSQSYDAFADRLHFIMNSVSNISFSGSVLPADPQKWSLQDLLNSSQDGLSHVPVDVLRRCVRPVLEGLQSIDAEGLLQLERIEDGAVVGNGVTVKPIHLQILPDCPADTVRYIHLSDLPGQYSMGIFVFPPHSKIPLHDHPGMCVLSRVLYGSLERLSLDLARDEDGGQDFGVKGGGYFSRQMERSPKKDKYIMPSESDFPDGTRLAYKNHVDHLQAPDCAVLYPFEGNLHEFVAGPQGAAVLDVLFPPYDDHDRDCTFYNILENSNALPDSSGRQPCWIEPTGQPEDFHCISGRYRALGSTDD